MFSTDSTIKLIILVMISNVYLNIRNLYSAVYESDNSSLSITWQTIEIDERFPVHIYDYIVSSFQSI